MGRWAGLQSCQHQRTLGGFMTNTDLVCGAGAACEKTCPVMLMGRICPDVPTFLDEVAALMGVSVEAPQLAPVPA